MGVSRCGSYPQLYPEPVSTLQAPAGISAELLRPSIKYSNNITGVPPAPRHRPPDHSPRDQSWCRASLPLLTCQLFSVPKISSGLCRIMIHHQVSKSENTDPASFTYLLLSAKLKPGKGAWGGPRAAFLKSTLQTRMYLLFRKSYSRAVIIWSRGRPHRLIVLDEASLPSSLSMAQSYLPFSRFSNPFQCPFQRPCLSVSFSFSASSILHHDLNAFPASGPLSHRRRPPIN